MSPLAYELWDHLVVIPPFLERFFHFLNELMHHPMRVIGFCLGLAFVSLVLEGSLLQLWSLHRDHDELTDRIVKIRTETEGLQMKIQKAKDPAYLEFEARERFDLADEGDLIFVFSDEDAP